MTGSPYSYYSRTPGPHMMAYPYDIGDPGPQYRMDMGTRGPQNGGSPFSHDTGTGCETRELREPVRSREREKTVKLNLVSRVGYGARVDASWAP